ncbi:MAG: hypothetical protein PHS30_10775, partial [Bacteroidales bacterium]|nr:hypothetical protein [Bacteroidales bacterium]
KVDSVAMERKRRDEKLWKEAYRVKPEQYKVSSITYVKSGEEKIVRIEKGRKETRITFAIAIGANEFWIYFSSALALVDQKTQARYMARYIEKGLAFDQTLVVTGCAKKLIEISVVFPPLKKSVEVIDIRALTENFPNKMSDGGHGFEFRNIRIAEYAAVKTRIYK